MEEYHEFLRGYTVIFTKNVMKTRDFTYDNLKGIINNKNLVVLKGGQASGVVVMDKLNYVSKFHRMTEEGINSDVYTPTMTPPLKI